MAMIRSKLMTKKSSPESVISGSTNRDLQGIFYDEKDNKLLKLTESGQKVVKTVGFQEFLREIDKNIKKAAE